MTRVLIVLFAAAVCQAAVARNEAAIQDLQAGRRTDANAAWWGWNPEDSTASIQAAIDSGARRVVVPFMGEPWVVRPIALKSNQEIEFQPGVVILAKKGEFRETNDSLFQAIGADNITLRGYGAIFRMRKSDYQKPPYKKGEWRMGVALRGCKNVRIEGIRVESTGGDGFYVAEGGGRLWSEDIAIRDCAAYDNHRQGLSVISVVNLLVENCVFAGTSGTVPEAGIDLEPDLPNQRLVNCVIRNSRFEDNNGHGMLVYLKMLDQTSAPVSIRFENCLSRMSGPGGGSAGMAVGEVPDKGPKGLIEFRDCTSENTGKEGAKVYDKSADSVLVRFVRCSWRNPWISPHPEDGLPRVPIMIEVRDPEFVKHSGGIDFKDCFVYDSVNRPVLRVEEAKSELGVRELHGHITVRGSAGGGARLGVAPVNCDLKVTLEH